MSNPNLLKQYSEIQQYQLQYGLRDPALYDISIFLQICTGIHKQKQDTVKLF